MPVKEVHLLEDGYLELDMGMLVYMKTPYYGIKYMAALKPLLVRTDNENIIVSLCFVEYANDAHECPCSPSQCRCASADLLSLFPSIFFRST